MTEAVHELPQPMQWRTIVVGLDHSELGQLALARALELATRFDATIHVVHAVPLAPPVTPGAVPPVPMTPAPDDVATHLRQRLEQEAIRWKATKFGSPSLHVRRGSPAQVISDVVKEVDADVVVLGTHGRSGLERMLLGSVSESVLRSVSCTVLLVRPKAHADD